ncbi:putative Membrane-spanning 4-domains subfamily A member 12-like protein [Naja naja]|nr:putative Membrane-spanning 4-domains subfamily A member 12-like protein [Naja naja]
MVQLCPDKKPHHFHEAKASGAIPYPQYGAQQLGISTSAPQQVPQGNPLERFLKAEPKVLGAVEILIGLIHIGFGAVSLSSLDSRTIYPCLTATGGYPFWGGIFFISSGSLCVAAANRPTHPLNVPYGLACVLLLFSMLQFCIAVSLAHFGCQTSCCLDDQRTVLFMPYQVIRGREVTDEPNPPPPTYDNLVTKSQ